MLYTVIILPLVQFMEAGYQFIYKSTDNAGVPSVGFSVIGLSVIVTLCTLPLYIIAEKWQRQQRTVQEKLASGVTRIKQTFKGDEQYMVLSAFYRENHYHPLMALRSSLSLLIQIPFFIAAYQFLSHLEPLNGASFLFIKDFGAPDGAFHVGSFAVNVLPIAMTLINCISGAVYSRGHDWREKLQIYISALVFLVLLYNSPAGLVVYWTMNNVFSLVKNILYKIKSKRILYALFYSICIALIAVIVFSGVGVKKKVMLTVALCAAALYPPLAKKIAQTGKSVSFFAGRGRFRLALFLISASVLAVLAGLVIPSILIESEPEHYCFVDSYKSPFYFIYYTFLQAIGLFIFWPACFYALFSEKVKNALAFLFSAFAFCAVLNCFAFSGNYGPINPDLILMHTEFPGQPVVLHNLNALFLAGLLVLFVLILKFVPKVIASLSSILLIGLCALFIQKAVLIQKTYAKIPAPNYSLEPVTPIFHLSKTGKNVLIFMADKCYSPFVPYVFDVHPELKENFSGFTYYPNTISLGTLTMVGTPGIWGGYDYTPFEINSRPEKTLQQKHNESILSMPVLFTENGWRATVSDIAYENYLQYPVTAMYKDFPKVERAPTRGVYSDRWYARYNNKKEAFLSTRIKRNFIWFSIMKMNPIFFRQMIYSQDYWSSSDYTSDTTVFINSYSEVDFLPELFDCTSERNSLVILDNEATHDPVYLRPPLFDIPSTKEAQPKDSPYASDKDFSTMRGLFLRLSEFFDYLKENGVYDNTRIIIVSDHGANTSVSFFEETPGMSGLNKDRIVATLLVKDFNADGAVQTDRTFMTNADTSAIVTDGIFENAKNPFTGNPFAVKDKLDYIKITVGPAESMRIRFNRKYDISDNEWVTVKDDIFKPENWSWYKPEREE